MRVYSPQRQWRSAATSFEPLGDTPILDIRIGGAPAGGGACDVGETRPIAGSVDGYLAPPDDKYLTLLRPSGCTACPPPSAIQLTTAHVILHFRFQQCDIPVDVSIVGSFPGECPVPDQSNVICPPTRYTLSASAFGYIDFALALPAGCCISEDAFLLIRFVDRGSCSPDMPLLGATAIPCNTCFSYNDHPTFGFIDICTDPNWPSDTNGNPTMYAEADCCGATPVESGTWGRVKTMYR